MIPLLPSIAHLASLFVVAASASNVAVDKGAVRPSWEDEGPAAVQAISPSLVSSTRLPVDNIVLFPPAALQIGPDMGRQGLKTR